MSVFGVQKTASKQNQQFNEILINNAKIQEIIGFPNQDLNIKSGKDNNLFLNNNVKVSSSGILGTKIIKINEGELKNDDNDLTWNDNVIITDATLEAELENLGIIVSRNNINGNHKNENMMNENETMIIREKVKEQKRVFPIGSIIQYPLKAKKIPYGWMVCDGSLIIKDDYPQMEDILENDEVNMNYVLPDIKSKKNINLIYVGFCKSIN
jgi:hypothetical protein